MQRAVSIFTPIRFWQALTLIFALLGSGLGAFTLTGGFESSAAVTLSENQQLVLVRRGDLIDAVDINGSIVFPNRERVHFEISGTVGEVFVEEGRRVSAGQPLAALDAATVAKLEEAAAKARVALDEARKRLDPPSAVEIAEAEAAVVKARADLHAAQEALDDAGNPFTELQLATQRQAVVQAKTDLQTAEEALADTLAVADADGLAVQTQRQAVVQAKTDLQTAEEALADTLAVADADGLTVQTQRQAVVQAKIDLQTAEEALADTLAAADADGLAVQTQRQAVVQAKTDLQTAEEALADALAVADADGLAVLTQRQAVVQAKTDLQTAEEALADAVPSLELQKILKQEETVAAARVKLADAREELAKAQEPPTAAAIDAAQGKIDAAKAARAADALTLIKVEKDQPGVLEAARSAFDAAQRVYNQALVDSEIAFVVSSDGPLLDPRTHVPLRDDELLLDPRVLRERIAPGAPVFDATFDAWIALIEARDAFEAAEAEQAVTEARRALTRKEQDLADAEEALAALIAPPDQLDIALKEATLATAEEDLAQAEQALADMLNETADPLDLELKRARVAFAIAALADEEARLADMFNETADPLDLELKRARVATAAAALADEEARLADMLNETPDPLDLELKRARAATAVAALADEEARLADMLDETPDPLDLELKRARVATAVAALADEEARLADMLDETPDPLDLELKRARVATAVAALADEEARLADMLAPTDALLIGQRKAEVEVAAARVGDTEEALADLVNGDPLVRALREREIESAESDLANAERDLASTEITTPIGGVVETVDTEAGDTVTPMAFAVEIVDTSVAEVDGVVDEIDVLFLNVGAEAVVTMDALLDQTLAGEVSSIETTGRTTGGVVSFPVRVRVEAPPGVDLREGLSAAASVVLRETTDALLVPSAAIGGSFLQPTVLVQRDGAITEQPVSLGDGDDFNVVVLAGLNEGDAVVVESTGGDLGIFGALFGGGQRLRQFIGGRPPPGAGR